jgi:hypothetical protein
LYDQLLTQLLLFEFYTFSHTMEAFCYHVPFCVYTPCIYPLYAPYPSSLSKAYDPSLEKPRVKSRKTSSSAATASSSSSLSKCCNSFSKRCQKEPGSLKSWFLRLQKKPYSAITVQVERLTSEQYEENDVSGIPDLIEVIQIQGSGPTEAARALRKKL